MKKFIWTFAMSLLVLTLNGQITFQKIYGGSENDIGNSIQQTIDGGYIIAGYTTNFGAGLHDAYLLKTNADGELDWTKTFGGTGEDYAQSVHQTTDGGYIIVGWTNSFSSSAFDVYLIKTNVNGDLLWTKTFGGSSSDFGYSVQQTMDGGYIITGITHGIGLYDVYLIKTDENGDSLWTKSFGGINNDIGWDVQQTSDSGYIVTGERQGVATGNYDVYIIKTNSSGDSLWTKTFGSVGRDYGYSIKQTSDGGYIVAGSAQSLSAGDYDIYLIKTDENGDSLWVKTIGGINDDEGFSVQQTIDGGYIIAGYTKSFGAGVQDVCLLKTNVDGELDWTKTFGGANSDGTYSMQQNTDGGYIICCNTTSFGTGNFDIYLIKTDSLGNSGCNQGSIVPFVNTPATQVTNPATIVSSPAIVVTNPPTLVSSGGNVITLCTNLGVSEIKIGNSIVLSPNPTVGKFTISFEQMIVKGNIEIYNILGKKVFSENIFNESKKEISLNNIASGLYFVKVFDGEKYFVKKLIIEHN